MGMLDRLARQMGLMIHHATKPASREKKETHTIHRATETSTPAPGVTLRRTVIEEIELKDGAAFPYQDAPASDTSSSGT